MKWMIGAAIGACVLMAGGLWLRSQPPALPILATLPEFTLVDSHEQPISLDDLRGQVWIADFIFTTCPSFCPRLSRQMASLQKRFDGAAEVLLVSFTVDPGTDDPARLREYARSHGADPTRWRFITGERRPLYELIRSGFLLAVSERTAEEALDGDGPIAHSDRFVLVDREGRIRGYYRGTDDDSVEELFRDAARLATTTAGAARPQ